MELEMAESVRCLVLTRMKMALSFACAVAAEKPWGSQMRCTTNPSYYFVLQTVCSETASTMTAAINRTVELTPGGLVIWRWWAASGEPCEVDVPGLQPAIDQRDSNGAGSPVATPIANTPSEV